MPPRHAINRLKLGPIVGHTTDSTSTIWIQVFDDPAAYQLRVQGAGLFPFVSTESPAPEFGTAIATASALRPDWRYQYTVLRKGRAAIGARGTFRTFPQPGSMAPILFCPVSCSVAPEIGAWHEFQAFVEKARPHFAIMMGDQVYIDEDEPDVFENHRTSPPGVRRAALAAKYRLNWARAPVRRVMAQVPVYMMWDDHDVRDGWGSLASDSPTLAAKYPRGRFVFEQNDAFFRDARDVYWHFQGCHNPPLTAPFTGVPFAGRTPMPYSFECGRVFVLMIDSRGARDVFRTERPVLGADQWTFIEKTFASLGEHIDLLVVMTPTPVASMDAEGASQKLVGRRTDDVEAFKKGNIGWFENTRSTKDAGDLLLAVAASHARRLTGGPVNLGSFQVSNIDEARDQWSHEFARPEQKMLLEKAARARFTNRSSGMPRELLFVSGDIHVGAIFDIDLANPKCRVVSLTSSGISTVTVPTPTVGATLDEDFAVAPGIRSKLRDVVTTFNFGIVQVLPAGDGARVVPLLSHEGSSVAVGLDIADLL